MKKEDTEKKEKKQKEEIELKKENTKKKESFFERIIDKTSKISKVDWKIMGILVFIYIIFAFYHLGTLQSPQTYYNFTFEGEDVGIEIATVSQEVSKIRYYTGPETGEFDIIVSTDGKIYKDVGTLTQNSVFAWEDYEINTDLKYIKFVAKSANTYMGDVQLYNKYGEKILVKASDDQSGVIVDELETVPVQISYLNSTYFDEIYFARSAYEYIHGIDTMEWVHPPLGKLIMMIPILLFGMSTFSYRLMGTIAGIIMIPVIYILAKKIFKNSKWALLAGILMTFDSFHFAQTRMGTVDSFLVLFIMLAALFMYQYITLDKDVSLKKKTKNLALSGLFMGCAIATKWTGLYAAMALAITFFVDLLYKYTDKRKKIEKDQMMKNVLIILGFFGILPIVVYYGTVLLTSKMSFATTLTILYYIIAIVFSILFAVIKLLKKDKKLWKMLALCCVYFVLVPIVIYVLCYLLFPNVVCYSDDNSIMGIIQQIKDMYTYHSTLTEGHPFSSDWYTWPIMNKPVWYYVGYFGGNIKSTIVGIGNPAIWWFGILASIFVLISSILKKKKEYLFILAFIVCTWLTYAVIGRAMFMYHFFPTLPFVMLAIVAFVKWITEKIKSNSFYIFYIAVVILIFLIFYPVVSGMTTTNEYIDSLKWLESWIF